MGSNIRKTEDQGTHDANSASRKAHPNEMNVNDHIGVLEVCTKSILFLETLEAIYQELERPEINKKEEWKSRELKIKLKL